jgi:glutamyl-tRNA reductase
VVELARNIFRDLDACQVLLVGAGEIARSVARALGERGATRLAVANRGAARAQEFHQEFPHAARLDFDQRLPALAEADLVIVSTGAGEPVVTRADVAGAMAGRRTRPLLVVDLGVPRNVEPAVGRLENVFLHSVDSLDHLIQRNLKRRKEEVPRVEEILEQELGRFHGWFRGIQAEPLVARLQKQAEEIRRAELAQALQHFPPGTHEHLDRLTRSLVRKILHYPSSRLRGRDGAEDLPRLDLVRELFQLDEDAEAAALTAAAGAGRERPGELPQPPADAAADPAPEARGEGERPISAPGRTGEEREPR